MKTIQKTRKQFKREQKTISKKTEKIETMKTRISQLVFAAFLTLILMGGNVSAKGTEVVASGYEKMEEPALKMENWMINNNYWDDTSYSNVDMTVDYEGSLDLENWMTDENSWETNNVNVVNNATETENELNVEPWMVSKNIWSK